MDIPSLVVRDDRVAPLKAGHPWLFSRGLKDAPRLAPGSLVELRDSRGGFLALGSYHPANTIRVRVMSRREGEKIDQAFFDSRLAELRRRKTALLPPLTSGYRLVHADADGLPGLVVDVYGERAAVFQIHTAGMEQFRGMIIKALAGLFKDAALVERSDLEARRQEGLEPRKARLHAGSLDGPVAFSENGLHFLADLMQGQKTGFFLDQRDARAAAAGLAAGRRVLNLFSYSCAFGVAAAKGGAAGVLNVDSSRPALELGRRQFALNDLASEGAFEFREADVFDWLQAAIRSRAPGTAVDFIICDPPAFARKRDDLDEALRAYAGLNRLCFELLGPGGLLLTSSCSGSVAPEEFQSAVRLAAGRAGRQARIIASFGQAQDHTLSLAFPEGRYLKTLVLELV